LSQQGRREHRDRRPDVLRLWREGKITDQEVSRENRGRSPRTREREGADLDWSAFEAVGMGTVLEMHRRTAVIRQDGHTSDSLCRFSPKLDLTGFGHLTVGDRIKLAREPISGDLFAAAVEPRRSKFSRPGPPDREHREQLLAANIDRLIVVCSAERPAFNPGLVDRYLVAAEHSTIPLTLVINKMDLVHGILPMDVLEFEGLVDEIIPVSAENGSGLEDLRESIEGQTVVLTGQSGVGKSSIIRKLVPGVEIRVGEVRVSDGKGRHTTTASTLYQLRGGGEMIDTPGIRGLGFWELSKQDLALVFPAFGPWAGSCKFSNCLHDQEPGCAIQKAVEEGELSERHLDAYFRILDSLRK
jgi:ribosome biogenesis GTPase